MPKLKSIIFSALQQRNNCVADDYREHKYDKFIILKFTILN